MNNTTCEDCTYIRYDDEGYPWCGKTRHWLPLRDLAYCCVYFRKVKE